MKRWQRVFNPLISGIFTALLYTIATWGDSEWPVAVGLFLGGVIGYYLFFIKELFFKKKNEKGKREK